MPASADTFSQSLNKLIKKFETDKAHYLSKDYSEAQAKIDFITPFFKALGWDVENEAGLLHHEREVIVEKGETEGRPDYNFRLAGQTKFFVEAKAPSEPLDSAKHILQAKGYAWNTKQVFFVILTDFEEFRFYDASIQPDERKPDEGLLLTLKYTDYLRSTEKLWEFSKERVAAGSLDAMLPRDRRTQRLRIPVDEAFLDEMTGWREDLARDVFKNNPDLTAKQLNEVVQRLLDRIVFIRIAEDRRIIEKMQLWDAVQHWKSRGEKFHIFDWLNDLFHRINEDFNGEIFKPHLSENIKIDSEVLAKIIERLYPPKSPYRFDVIGVELLGSIYERYLGKTIRPTAKTVRVEEKPEVRKAGGVYYTPKYIVDYIVKNTVGKVIEGKSPKQIEKIHILDPACGSGSFLIGAFQYLIDYHVRYLTAHPKEAHIHPLFPDLIRDGNPSADGHRLSVRLKAKILRNNLYGVDIDPQAVEITMMSLYLKALEGEKSQLPPKQSLLPELKYNIICGNSLIGPDIYDQGTLFADEERDRINAFDWHSETAGFGRIMKEGGFDCVIGNPPYFNVDSVWGKNSLQAAYLRGTYHDVWQDKTDILFYFIARALKSTHGLMGFIVSRAFLEAYKAEKLRQRILDVAKVVQVVDFDGFQVFDAGITTAILVLERCDGHGARNKNLISVLRLTSAEAEAKSVEAGLANHLPVNSRAELFEDFVVPQARLSRTPWNLSEPATSALYEKIDNSHPMLDSVCQIGQGMQTGRNDVFAGLSRSGVRKLKLPRNFLRKRAANSDILRYHIRDREEFIIYVEDLRAYSQCPAAIAHYLEMHRRELGQRAAYKRGNCEWWKFTWPLHKEWYDKAKLLCPFIGEANRFALDGTKEFIGLTDTTVLFKKDHTPEDLRYVLGILNSNLLTFRFRGIGKLKSKGVYEYFWNSISRLPIRGINFSDPADKARHDRMVALVERMLELHKKKDDVEAPFRAARGSARLKPGATPELERLERGIAATDAEIDELVYELYGITDEERNIIQGG